MVFNGKFWNKTTNSKLDQCHHNSSACILVPLKMSVGTVGSKKNATTSHFYTIFRVESLFHGQFWIIHKKLLVLVSFRL